MPQLRQAVAEYYCRTQGVCYTDEDVLIGPGSKELMFLLQFVYYGDLVIPTPSWVSYAPQANIIGRHVYWLSTTRENKWRLTADELVEHCKEDPNRPRIVILNYPSNPSGSTYTIEELKKIAKVAREHKIILISDEIYGELHHKGKHVSIAKFYPEGTIISGGISKWCGAGGWRLGTFTFPSSLRWLLDAMAAVASETFTSTSAPIQFASVRAFQGGIKIERYLWNCRKILSALGKAVSEKLIKAGVHVYHPDGAFYVFPDFSDFEVKFHQRGYKNSIDFCNDLLEQTGVAILPGSAFGRPKEEFTARISYVDFDGTRALAAAEELNSDKEFNGDFVENYCATTLKAVDLICDFIKA